MAIFYQFPDWNWDKLSIQYRNSPYTTLDEAIIGFSSPSVGADNLAEDVNATCKFVERVESFVEEVHCNDQQEKSTGAGKKAIQSKASTCRDLLIKLKSATYLVHDAKALDELNTAFQSTLTFISDFIPNKKGLQLNGEETTPTPPQKSTKKGNPVRSNNIHWQKFPTPSQTCKKEPRTATAMHSFPVPT